MANPSPPSPTSLLPIDGSEQDAAVTNSQFLTRPEVLNRRARRAKDLAKIYREHYWALMDDLKTKHRQYYWRFGQSPFADEDDESEKVIPCGYNGCKAKAMALTRFCHMHILSDADQKLYKKCSFSTKSSVNGPIPCCVRPVLRSTVPCYCPLHFQLAEKHMVRALKKAGLNVGSSGKVAPKLHAVVAEYVRQIQNKRRATQIKEEGRC